MSIHTKLMFKGRLKNKIPDEVNKVLHYLFNNSENCKYWTFWDDWKKAHKQFNPFLSYKEFASIAYKPNLQHEFFKTDYWRDLSSSYNFYRYPYIFCSVDFKNYNEEIQKFLNWIKPYLRLEEGDWLGTMIKEGWQEEKVINLYKDSIQIH